MRRARGVLNLTVEEFSAVARRPEGLVTELPGGRSVSGRFRAAERRLGRHP